MGTRLRWFAVFAGIAVALLVPAQASTGILRVTIKINGEPVVVSVDVASIESEQDIDPPSYGRTLYRALGSTNNRITASLNDDFSTTFTDPNVLMVASREGTPQCTSGLGSSRCNYIRWLGIDGGLGDDTIDTYDAIVVGGPGDDNIVVRADPDQAEPGGAVHCNEGYDRVIAHVGIFVDADCEEVTIV